MGKLGFHNQREKIVEQLRDKPIILQMFGTSMKPSIYRHVCIVFPPNQPIAMILLRPLSFSADDSQWAKIRWFHICTNVEPAFQITFKTLNRRCKKTENTNWINAIFPLIKQR